MNLIGSSPEFLDLVSDVIFIMTKIVVVLSHFISA